MQTGLAGKVVIVTAATANIGRGIALAFAAEGARVVITGRDPVAGELVAKLAREQGAADVLWRPADMTVEDEVAGMVAATLAAFGQIDVLVNNVGGNVAVTPFASSTPEQWRADLELNLMTMFRCTHLVLPSMLDRGSGRIINIGSTAGFIGDRFLAVYSAAKGGVHAFTRVLALELGRAGSRSTPSPPTAPVRRPVQRHEQRQPDPPGDRRVRAGPGGGPGAHASRSGAPPP